MSTPNEFTVKSVKLIGRKISQSYFKDVNKITIQAGQSILCKLLIITIIFLLIYVSGSLYGFLGSKNLFDICFSLPIYQLAAMITAGCSASILLHMSVVKDTVQSSLFGLFTGLFGFPLILSFVWMITKINGIESLLLSGSAFSVLLFMLLIFSTVLLMTCFGILNHIFCQSSRLLLLSKISAIGIVLGSALLTAFILERQHLLAGGDIADAHSQGKLGSAVPLICMFGSVVYAIAGSFTAMKGAANLSSMTSKEPFLRKVLWIVASFGGTSFLNLDLSNINLSGSKIANSDFRASKFYRTSLRGVTGLQYARVDDRYLDLDRPKVQELLIFGQSRESDFQRVTLRGAYLQDANLQDLNFTEANLDSADCRNADLRRAIFIRTIATNIDFTHADLTGCCIKDWSINRQTVFTGINCDYIYQNYGEGRPSERYPRDRNFEPGEFESILNRVETSYEMVIHDRIDPLALSFTFQQFELDDSGLGLKLKGLEQRGDNWIVKVGYQEGSSSQAVTSQVNRTYEDLRLLFETRYQLALEAKESEITRLNQMMTDAMQRFVNRTSGNVTIQGEGNRVYVADNLGNIMESQNINISGTVGGNLVTGDVTASNLGTMMGNLNATIETMRSNTATEVQDLANLIEQIKSAIIAEDVLSSEQKQEALEAVATIAEEGQKSTESRVKKLSTMAVNALKGIRTSVSDASNLATVLQTTLPLVKLLLGLP
jgi:uncharacterized protein YjbI with pentapeptide repeats